MRVFASFVHLLFSLLLIWNTIKVVSVGEASVWSNVISLPDIFCKYWLKAFISVVKHHRQTIYVDCHYTMITLQQVHNRHILRRVHVIIIMRLKMEKGKTSSLGIEPATLPSKSFLAVSISSPQCSCFLPSLNSEHVFFRSEHLLLRRRSRRNSDGGKISRVPTQAAKWDPQTGIFEVIWCCFLLALYYKSYSRVTWVNLA